MGFSPWCACQTRHAHLGQEVFCQLALIVLGLQDEHGLCLPEQACCVQLLGCSGRNVASGSVRPKVRLGSLRSSLEGVVRQLAVALQAVYMVSWCCRCSCRCNKHAPCWSQP